jgi:hypothetical protein
MSFVCNTSLERFAGGVDWDLAREEYILAGDYSLGLVISVSSVMLSVTERVSYIRSDSCGKELASSRPNAFVLLLLTWASL